jgi:hypothetical protein
MGRQRARKWACTRQTAGVKCNTMNEPGTRKCRICGKPRPPKRKPQHMGALVRHDYDYFTEINGGEYCGICGITRAQTKNPEKRLMRDHAHTTTGLGEPRGLLCFDCNWHLGTWYTPERVRAMLDYLERHETRMARKIIDESEAA